MSKSSVFLLVFYLFTPYFIYLLLLCANNYKISFVDWKSISGTPSHVNNFFSLTPQKTHINVVEIGLFHPGQTTKRHRSPSTQPSRHSHSPIPTTSLHGRCSPKPQPPKQHLRLLPDTRRPQRRGHQRLARPGPGCYRP